MSVMEDETKTEEDTKEDIVDDGSTNMSDKAIAAADRLEKANEQTSKNLDRQENLMARQALGGRSVAGTESSPKTQDELDEEAAKLFMEDDE